jgi:hypothetical protein
MHNCSIVARMESAATFQMHGGVIERELADLGVDLGTRAQQICAGAAEVGNTTLVADQ